LDLDGAVVDDFQLINRYREMSNTPEVDEAIDQIINEFIVQEDAERLPVSLDLDYVDNLEEELKIRIQAEFDGLLKQLNFHKDAYSVVRQWYVDGRVYYYIIVDEANEQNGILELRLIDPRTIKKVREVTRKRHEESQVDIVEVQREYFVYNPMGFVAPNINGVSQGAPTGSMLQYNGIKITCDAIAYVPSGLFDPNRRTVLSWLHKGIKPMNMLRMMEDSCVIYRIARAPERRVFYIDVGNLPKGKAEQYLNDLMLKYRNKLVYDVSTGELRDDRKHMSMLEDFWLPRKEGNKGTEITTLPAGQNSLGNGRRRLLPQEALSRAQPATLTHRPKHGILSRPRHGNLARRTALHQVHSSSAGAVRWLVRPVARTPVASQEHHDAAGLGPHQG
jgi:hypothetical protein